MSQQHDVSTLFPPTSRKELAARGWDRPDVVFFTGDAYIDHPAFGTAVLARVLEAKGYRVAVVPQPNWQDDLRDFKKMGAPRLFFSVSSGAMDSMVNHYTANKRLRSDDAYTPEGKAGFRPDYAVNVYAGILKRLFPDVPVVIGGIEASMRRLTHYDYWQDRLLPGILVSSGADLLVYGMGETALTQLADRLAAGETIDRIRDLPQTAYLRPAGSRQEKGIVTGTQDFRGEEVRTVRLHSYETCCRQKRAFAENFKYIEETSNIMSPEILIEPVGDREVVVNPFRPRFTTDEMDAIYDLPYTRLPHPRYKGRRIPAYDMIKFSVCLHRGCFGGCSFCTISAHQGKFISSRSEASVLKEVARIAAMPDFKGYISDLGGPSANMYALQGIRQELCSKCRRPSCLFPQPCRNLSLDMTRLTALYRKVNAMPGIRKAFIGSGIRYDMLLTPDGRFRDASAEEYFRETVCNHVSGRLKVAPEHTSDRVLRLMRKPPFQLFEHLKRHFDRLNNEGQLRQQIIPYFISGHPGCQESDMRQLQDKMRRLHFRLEQVQDFTPTPMTLSSTMFYTGLDPMTMQPVFVARDQDAKRRQRSYFFDGPPQRSSRR